MRAAALKGRYLSILLASAAIPGCSPAPATAQAEPDLWAIGHFYACDAKGFCEDVEQNFTSMAGCQVRMMPFMAQWIGEHAGFRPKTGRFECIPHSQTRV